MRFGNPNQPVSDGKHNMNNKGNSSISLFEIHKKKSNSGLQTEGNTSFKIRLKQFEI